MKKGFLLSFLLFTLISGTNAYVSPFVDPYYYYEDPYPTCPCKPQLWDEDYHHFWFSPWEWHWWNNSPLEPLYIDQIKQEEDTLFYV